MTNSEMQHLLERARDARPLAAQLAGSVKDAVLTDLADWLRQNRTTILAANAEDVRAAQDNGLSPRMIDRLRLDDARIEAMAGGVGEITAMADPVGAVMTEWSRPNGLRISRVRTPLGVVGVIYESRPNVTIDAAALCFKAGNVVVLRGGKEAMATNRVLADGFVDCLKARQICPDLVQWVSSSDRGLVGMMLSATGLIDVLVPRGGKSLVERVMNEARVPIFAHLQGIVHLYLHHSADPAMAERVILNAKMRRTSICGAAECLLVDRAFPGEALGKILDALLTADCRLRGDPSICALDQRIEPANADDWGHEYLDAVLAVRYVADQAEAEAHIARYSSHHTEVILADDTDAVEGFFHRVDSAIVMHNASSQFADGGEFGMGAEIGISTGRFHARGPIGVEQLTSFHYRVRGCGATRP